MCIRDRYWRVLATPSSDTTTTVQLFDAQGEKIAQDDQPPGGIYYPTSHWKAGETLVEHHRLTLSPADSPMRMLVGMYSGPALTPLAPPLTVELPVK